MSGISRWEDLFDLFVFCNINSLIEKKKQNKNILTNSPDKNACID